MGNNLFSSYAKDAHCSIKHKEVIKDVWEEGQLFIDHTDAVQLSDGLKSSIYRFNKDTHLQLLLQG